MGHLLTKDGLKSDPDKVRAIKEMPQPDGPKAVQRSLGMVTFHVHASHALTKTQEGYAQIEKELLTVVFACTKFHDYIYGTSKEHSDMRLRNSKLIGVGFEAKRASKFTKKCMGSNNKS